MSSKRTISVRKCLVIAVPVVLTIFLTGSGYWLLRTSSGAAFLWGRLESATAGAVRAAGTQGDFASGFVVRGLVYQSENIDLSVASLTIQAGPGWWPLAVEVKNLTLEDVVISNSQAEDQAGLESGDTDIGTVLSSLDFTVPILIEQAKINNIMLHQVDGVLIPLVDSVEMSVSLDQQLTIDELIIEAGGLSVKLAGNLQLHPPFYLSATVDGNYETDDETTDLVLKLPFKLNVEGQIDNWSFELESDIHSAQTFSSRLAANGAGTSQSLNLQKLSLHGQAVDLDMQGKLDWSAAPKADVEVRIRRLDLSPWLAEWPVGSFIEGGCEINWSQTGLTIPVCKLSVNETDLTLDLDANIDVETKDLSAHLQWHNLDWPPGGTDAVFSSPSGQLHLAGSIDKWSADGPVELRIGDFPQGRFELQAEGGRDHLKLLVPAGEILGGSISGEANVDWSDGLSWKTVINAQGINTAPVLPKWPGHLNAKLTIEGTGTDRNIRVNISNLDGRIRDVPVYAHGSFGIENSNVSFNLLEARTDRAVLLLDGNALDPKGISMTFSGELPELLLWGAHGSIEAQGRYSRHAGSPTVELNLQALDLGWNDNQVRELSIRSHGPGTVPELQLDAIDVSLSGVLLDEVSMSLNPDGTRHGLSVSFATQDMVFNSQAVLTPSVTDQPFSGGWRADIVDMTLAISQSYVFSLLDPARFDWSADESVLGPLCLKETAGARVCVNGEYKANGESSLIAEISAVPLNYLQDLFELDLDFEQILEGRLEWHQAVGQAPTGGASFRMTAGKVLDLEDNEILVETREGQLAFKLQNGNLESGTLDLEFPGIGYIDVDFDILDIIDENARVLKGRAFAQLDDIQALGQLILPGIDEVGGHFESTIQMSGTLADPVFEGGFKLSGGLVEYAPVGLRFEDIEFEGQIDKLDQGSFKGSFRAGEGNGLINGQFLFNDFENIQLDVDFSGEQLLLTNTDQLKLRTETKINIALRPQQMDINGFITIPSAHFSPSNLLLGGVTDSADLIIEPIEGELETAVKIEPPAYRVYGDLVVTFGDDVLIEVPGLETKLTGSVNFKWSGEPLPIAQGSYRLNGTVDMYGPVLHINNGHISFPGVVADNPVLNIRAQREIFGNTQIRSAGVQVIGTLKRPLLEAFTVPVTNQDRAWTILITGTDFDQGQGVNGFDVGTYIAPRLYVSYGISLFEDENVVSARYDLKKGFGIKVSSGQRETGLDVSYTIDK